MSFGSPGPAPTRKTCPDTSGSDGGWRQQRIGAGKETLGELAPDPSGLGRRPGVVFANELAPVDRGGNANDVESAALESGERAGRELAATAQAGEEGALGEHFRA